VAINWSVGQTLVKVIVGTGEEINGATIVQSVGQTRGKSGIINFIMGNAGGAEYRANEGAN
jgi:hypothetical protein